MEVRIPDRPFHNFRAWDQVVVEIYLVQERRGTDFWAFKVVEGPVVVMGHFQGGGEVFCPSAILDK